MELQVVNFKQAEALKGLGFPQLFINLGYYEDKKLHHSEDPYREVKHLIAVAPFLELVAKWLRERVKEFSSTLVYVAIFNIRYICRQL